MSTHGRHDDQFSGVVRNITAHTTETAVKAFGPAQRASVRELLGGWSSVAPAGGGMPRGVMKPAGWLHPYGEFSRLSWEALRRKPSDPGRRILTERSGNHASAVPRSWCVDHDGAVDLSAATRPRVPSALVA